MLDILVFAAHPDDAELGCGGSIAKWAFEGLKIGVIDFTRGELGTRGTPELRMQEAAKAQEILKLTIRENLGFHDGFFNNDQEHQLALIQKIRKHQPKIIITNAPTDRHPDHARACELTKTAVFLSGLRKVITLDENGQPQQAWKPKHLFHYIQDQFIVPNFVVDITAYFNTKIQAIQAYQSQFYNPHSKEPQTYISSQDFWDGITSRAREMGRFIETTFGEGFLISKPLPLNSIQSLL